MLATLAFIVVQGPVVKVDDLAGLRNALRDAKPGTTVLLAQGTYTGGLHVENLHGQPGKPIVIAGASRSEPPTITGGATALQFSKVSHLEIRDLRISKCSANGLNIDDGGAITSPSHHITLKRLSVADLPRGNHDGIKLSGVDDFRVEDCSVERWGGSGIDMVGCHRGVIDRCLFREGGDNGVQMKGGTSDARVVRSRFIDAGQRSLNLGGSTGLPYFRPAVKDMGPKKFEARNITVEGCTIVRGGAAVAFVGVDGAAFRFNTIYHPGRWALRILQETAEPGFVPCRKGVFSENVVVFSSASWASGGVNVGAGTEHASFRFVQNFWFCSDNPARSTPALPTAESNGTYGQDPKLTISREGIVKVAPDSPATQVGAHAYRG